MRCAATTGPWCSTGRPRRPGVDSGCIHDVAWYLRHLAAALTSRLIADEGRLCDFLAASIEETSKGAHAGTCDLANPDSPTSTVSVIWVRGAALDYLTLADSRYWRSATGTRPPGATPLWAADGLAVAGRRLRHCSWLR